jgi:hypothetical protein
VEQQKKDEILRKQQEKSDKKRNQLSSSYRKYRAGQKLGVADYKNLLHHVYNRGDSPIRSKLKDLHQQWEQRKVRYDFLLDTPGGEQISSTAEVCTTVPTTNTTVEI